MALEFISKCEINGKILVLPRGSSNGEMLIYRIDFDRREINFFYTKRQEEILDIGIWKVPAGAREMGFDIFDKDGCYIPFITFYDRKGKEMF